MPVEIRVPSLGESIIEATITQWLKHEGEPVTAGEALVELETDKVNVTVDAEQSGVLQHITRKEGDTVAVDEVLGQIAEGNGAMAPAKSEKAAAKAEKVPASAPGATVEAVQPAPQAEPGNGRPKTPATPMAEKLAAEKGLDLATVKGSGPGGKVLKEDVATHAQPPAFVASPVAEPPPAPVAPRPERPSAPAVESRPAPSLIPESPTRREDRVRMSRLRETIATRLVKAKQEAAMLTTFNEVDMSAILEVRKRRKESFKERHGVGLGFMSFFTKAVLGALKAFPMVNAEIQGNEIIVKHYYDIGIAVGTEEGLIVPVLRDADRKSFAQIEREIADLASRARDRKITLPELQGGTFTITNGGVYGSLMSTPILNTPQVGILGMHKVEERPIAVNGEVVIRPMMYVALSYDHRIIDGSEAVRFLVRVKELVEDPETLLLEG